MENGVNPSHATCGNSQVSSQEGCAQSFYNSEKICAICVHLCCRKMKSGPRGVWSQSQRTLSLEKHQQQLQHPEGTIVSRWISSLSACLLIGRGNCIHHPHAL